MAPTRTAPGSTAFIPSRRARAKSRTVHFPRSCLHCETPACVTVCPTGASYKRAEDGIVLVDPDTCIGCKLCSWACPYGAREYDYSRRRHEEVHAVRRPHLQRDAGAGRPPAGVRARLSDRCPPFRRPRRSESDVSKLVAERDGYGLMPELGYNPVNRYLPPRERRNGASELPAPARTQTSRGTGNGALDKFFAWADKALSR